MLLATANWGEGATAAVREQFPIPSWDWVTAQALIVQSCLTEVLQVRACQGRHLECDPGTFWVWNFRLKGPIFWNCEKSSPLKPRFPQGMLDCLENKGNRFMWLLAGFTLKCFVCWSLKGIKSIWMFLFPSSSWRQGKLLAHIPPNMWWILQYYVLTNCRKHQNSYRTARKMRNFLCICFSVNYFLFKKDEKAFPASAIYIHLTQFWNSINGFEIT